MKFRNFIIVLLAVLMAFAFASCKQEPKEEPKPAPASTKIYKLTATTGRNTSWNGADKFTLHWDEEVAVGDTLSFKFRATNEFTQFSIRNNECAWVYEQGLDKLTSLELGEDGWYTLTYEFSDTFLNGSKAAPSYPSTTKDFRIDLRGNILEDDYIEIKDVTFAGQPLDIEAENVYTHSQAYGAVNPTLEVISDHAWTVPKTHVVFFATEEPGDSSLPFDYERVADNAVFQTELEKANYTYSLYEDSGFSTAFAADTPITKDMTIFVKYVGDPRTIKYMDGETVLELEPTTAEYGSYINPPAAPEKDDKLFRGWYKEDNSAFDFASPITENLVLYAKYEDPITVSFVVDGGLPAPEDQKILTGATATRPETDPAKDDHEFLGWFVSTEEEAAEFDFTKGINADTSIYAKYREAQKFTVTFNLNYAECPSAEEVDVYDGKKVAKPEDPEREGFYFEKWTTTNDPEAAAYDFDTIVSADLQLYAQWSEPVVLTVNMNYGETPETKNYSVKKGETPVVQIGRAGWYLEKFTSAADAASETYEVGALNESKTVYAQWTAPDKYYKFTATKGTDGEDDYKYDQDKFAVKFASSIVVNPGDVVSIVFKAERTDAMTLDRPFTYSIRGAKKWFSEVGEGSKSYPQFWSTFEKAEDGWIYATYVFPPADAAVKDAGKIVYPATFRIDFRDTKIAVGENADILYVKGIALNGKPLALDEEATAAAYSAPTIQYLDIE